MAARLAFLTGPAGVPVPAPDWPFRPLLPPPTGTIGEVRATMWRRPLSRSAPGALPPDGPGRGQPGHLVCGRPRSPGHSQRGPGSVKCQRGMTGWELCQSCPIPVRTCSSRTELPRGERAVPGVCRPFRRGGGSSSPGALLPSQAAGRASLLGPLPRWSRSPATPALGSSLLPLSLCLHRTAACRYLTALTGFPRGKVQRKTLSLSNKLNFP